MHALDTARQLAKDIRDTEEYRTYAACKEALAGEAGIGELLREFKRLQVSVQMGAMTGSPASAEDTGRFSQLSSLLFADSRTGEYLMAEMRLQRLMAEIFGVLTKAADIDMGLPV